MPKVIKEFRMGYEHVTIYDNGDVTIEKPYGRVEHTTFNDIVIRLRGELLIEAIEQMRKTGKNYAIVKCPCCGRLVKITIEEVNEDPSTY